MRKIERLKKEALESCKWRGHKMKRFVSHYNRDLIQIAYAHCAICDKQVIVRNKPAPNSIEIGGDAVALNCEGEK